MSKISFQDGGELDRWLSYIEEQHVKDIDMGLDRMNLMIDRLGLGNPDHKVITVAGTNGKGSTCVATEQLLLSHGLRVGTTLSPHVFRFNERIRVQGIELSDQDICESFEIIESARDGLPLTYFEFSSLAALVVFDQADLDIAILEIGLGGRLDAFNVVDADVAVITSIGYDHQEFLGDSLEEIGAEKAGIFRSKQTVVLGANMPESVHQLSNLNQCEQSSFGIDFDISQTVEDEWDFQSKELIINSIRLGSLSAHNLSLGIEVAKNITELNPDLVSDCLPKIKLQGRMSELLLDDHNYLFDVCHNAQGVDFLINELELRNIKPDFIICGMFRNKDHAQVYSRMSKKLNAKWVLIDTFGARGFGAEELKAAMAVDALCLSGFENARRWVNQTASQFSTVLAFGSFNVLEQACNSMNVSRIC